MTAAASGGRNGDGNTRIISTSGGRTGLQLMSVEGSSRAQWTRPEGAWPYPREWDRFEGLKPMPDGRVPSFWIRDLSPALEDAAVEYMKQQYIREEAMAGCLRIADHPPSMAEWESLWRKSINGHRVSLAAFTDWPDGQERLVGVNIMCVVLSSDPPFTMEGERSRPGFQLYNELLEEADVFNKYRVRSYLAGMGLSVHRDFRGQAVGLRLLRARDPLCAALHIPLTVTAFSGAQSQKQARRAGFEVVASRRYADFTLEDGTRPLEDAAWTHLEIQAKFYGPTEEDQ